MSPCSTYIQENRDRFLNELFDLLRIPSVSADPAFAGDVTKCAESVAEHLRAAGAEGVEIIPTGGYPVVYGEKIIGPDAPTVLVYGHYDVQPADPLELWDSPAFEPVIKTTDLHPEGAIFARGACDDKGQMFMHIKALEAMVQADALHCNVKFMIEGEEEVGSAHLEPFLEEHREKLSADIVLVSDTGIIANDIPSITVGLRGLSYVEVEVTGPNRDLHSGLYGGAAPNPINILCEMIASLKDEDQRITVEGFYDDVVELSASEREAMAEAPFNEEEYKSSIAIGAVEGEKGYSAPERMSIRPTLGCERHLGRLHGRRSQDGHCQQSIGQNLHAVGSKPKPRNDYGIVRETLQCHCPTLSFGKNHSHAWWTAGGNTDRFHRIQGGFCCHGKFVWPETGAVPRRRIDSNRCQF